jgi:thiamine phosphate synthase YjbQ (UPF0047 family)
MKYAAVSGIVFLAIGAIDGSAFAAGREPLRGPHPWDFPDRNRETSFALQYAHDNRQRGKSGVNAGYGSTVVINNTTMAVGNWQQIEMTLGDNAEGLIMTENHQDNTGTSRADSTVMEDTTNVFDNGMERGDHYHNGKTDDLRKRGHARLENADGIDREDHPCGRKGYSCWGGIE